MGKPDMMYDLIDHDLTNSEFPWWIEGEFAKKIANKSGFAKKVVNSQRIRQIDSEFNVNSWEK